MPVHIFRSTDVGLTGVVSIRGEIGSLPEVLDVLLGTTGFNSQASVSVSRTGSVATFTKTGHGFTNGKGVVITNTGFAASEYNITGTAYNITANTWDMTVSGTPANEGAVGTSKRAGLGWTTTWTGTNIRSYQQPGGSNGFTLGVDDTIAQNSRIRGFTSMTAAGVADASGTGDFPTDAQLSGGCYFYKSSAASSLARPWILVSNGKILYFLNEYSGTTTTGNGFIFGDFYSRMAGDVYNTIIVGDIAASATTTACRIGNCVSTFTTNSGHWICSDFTGVGGSVATGKAVESFRCGAATEISACAATYPHPIEGGLLLMPIMLPSSAIANGMRGTLPGLWNIAHASRVLEHGDTFSGKTGTPLEGRTFEVWNVGSAGQICFETSDTWSAPV